MKKQMEARIAAHKAKAAARAARVKANPVAPHKQDTFHDGDKALIREKRAAYVDLMKLFAALWFGCGRLPKELSRAIDNLQGDIERSRPALDYLFSVTTSEGAPR